MRFDARDLALGSVFAALYGVLVIAQGATAAASVQFRFADCLISLCALFGWPVVFGVGVGAFVGNVFTSLSLPFGVLDLVLGPLVNLLAGATVYLLRRRRLAGCVLASVEVGVVVGSYVWLIFGAPVSFFGVGFPVVWPFWFASVVSVTVSSLLAVGVVGYLLLRFLGGRGVVDSLRARGVRIVDDVPKG